MLQLFILYLAITECIQFCIADKKIIKWILPICNLLLAMFVDFNLIVYIMGTENKTFLQATLDADCIGLFLILNIPTLIYVITNKIKKKRINRLNFTLKARYFYEKIFINYFYHSYWHYIFIYILKIE